MIKFMHVDPRPSARGDVLKVLESRKVLGIEVTVPELAAACSEGNVDPQHSGGNANLAACEVALGMSLDRHADLTLATNRTDLDSVAAMAVILMNANGQSYDVAKVRKIAEYDKFDHGPWLSAQPAPDWQVRALNKSMTSGAEIDLKVQEMIWWLRGELDLSERAEESRLHSDRAAAACRISRVSDQVVLVESSVPSRTPIELGYEQAPIVILFNPAMPLRDGGTGVKYSVCVWPTETRRINLARVVSRLNEIEAGWGGSLTIIGSPQGVSSSIAVGQLSSLVADETFG